MAVCEDKRLNAVKRQLRISKRVSEWGGTATWPEQSCPVLLSSRFSYMENTWQIIFVRTQAQVANIGEF
jgi:hypothetical protein